MTFSEHLALAQEATGARLCVGLDPDPSRLPIPFASFPDLSVAITEFCKEIIEATSDLACAYKPNLAFFEALGAPGWRAFEDVVASVPRDRILIADAKRGDIGSTADRYAEAFFGRLPCHAVTASPYMGADALTPFLRHADRCTFALVLTSNQTAEQLQMLEAEGSPLYSHAARLAAEAGERQPGEIGFVVGGTRPTPLAELREAYPEVPFLVPGVGAQGGSASEVIRAAGQGPLIVNASRAVLYASGEKDFAVAARDAAQRLRDELAL